MEISRDNFPELLGSSAKRRSEEPLVKLQLKIVDETQIEDSNKDDRDPEVK